MFNHTHQMPRVHHSQDAAQTRAALGPSGAAVLSVRPPRTLTPSGDGLDMGPVSFRAGRPVAAPDNFSGACAAMAPQPRSGDALLASPLFLVTVRSRATQAPPVSREATGGGRHQIKTLGARFTLLGRARTVGSAGLYPRRLLCCGGSRRHRYSAKVSNRKAVVTGAATA